MSTVVRTLLACTLVVLAAAADAHAQPADKAGAESAFRLGDELELAGKIAEACAAFEQSYDLEAALGTLFRMAECHRTLGKTATAWGEFAEVAERDRNAGRREAARVAAEELEPRLVKLAIVQPSAQPGLRVRCNDSDVSKLLGAPFPVNPGPQSIEATLAGHDTWTETVEVSKEGAVVVVEIPALAVSPAPPEPPPADTRDPAPPLVVQPGLGGRRIAAIALGTVGVLAAAGGTYFGLAARARRDDALDAGCERDTWVCPDDDAAALVDQANDRALASTILFATGGAALATGLILWFTAPDRAERVAIAPLTAGGAVVSLRGSF